mmetsp:Transcript_98622/g.212716  ORF Transcript_98622/g.212716 Transcript_98622/m.212716 type:complete len:107 (-) Transcript_98622:9-329(-)
MQQSHGRSSTSDNEIRRLCPAPMSPDPDLVLIRRACEERGEPMVDLGVAHPVGGVTGGVHRDAATISGLMDGAFAALRRRGGLNLEDISTSSPASAYRAQAIGSRL